jgi:hypothetical protein
MSEGEDLREKQQSGEDEELYTVRLTIYPRSVSGLPHSSQETDRQTEDRLYDALLSRQPVLATELRDMAENVDERWPIYEHIGRVRSEVRVRFTLRDLRIQRGSITLIAILGVVWVGFRDYEAVRRGLMVVANDMRSIVEGLGENLLPHWWAIDSTVMVGTPSAQPPAGGSSETRTQRVIDWTARVPQRSSNWAARNAFILYLVITNVVLIVLLGLLLLWKA